jgi:hypothetical protein
MSILICGGRVEYRGEVYSVNSTQLQVLKNSQSPERMFVGLLQNNRIRKVG